jgi:hypothetical protein
MNVHVICCNDMVVFAVIEDEEKARAKMDQLKTDDYQRNKWRYKDEIEYKLHCYWHIHTVDGE